MFVGRQGVGARAADNDFNRAYGVDLGWQATRNGRVFAFLARTDSPASKGGSDYAGRASYTYVHPSWTAGGGYAQVGDAFNPEVGFLRRRAFRSAEGRFNLSYQPKRWPWIRRIQPHTNFTRVHQPAERARKLVGPLALLRHPDAHRRAIRLPD